MNSNAHVLPSGLTAGAFRVGGAKDLIRSILNEMGPIGACDLLYKVMESSESAFCASVRCLL